MSERESTADAAATRCAECGTTLADGMDREVTDGGAFCRPCFNNLRETVQRALEAQTTDINYSMAVLGGVLGAVVGVAAWWGFTVVTNIAFGLIAVVIGFTVGKGVILASGGKRGTGLQVISVVISAVAFIYATYLVNRSFIHRAWSEEGRGALLPLAPDPALFYQVVSLGFGVMDLVFLAIVIWQAWKIPAAVGLDA